MRNTYSSLVEHAYNLIKKANNEYLNVDDKVYTYIISGKGDYLVAGPSGGGHNCSAVVDAIHLFYKDYPDSHVDDKFYSAIKNIINNVTNLAGIRLALDPISCEVEKESYHTNEFTIDCQKLLNDLRIKIEENYTNIEKEYPNIDRWLNGYASYLHINFGYTFVEYRQ